MRIRRAAGIRSIESSGSTRNFISVLCFSIRYSGPPGVAHGAVEQPSANYIIYAMRLVMESRESDHLHDYQADLLVHRPVALYERGILADCARSLEKRYSRAQS